MREERRLAQVGRPAVSHILTAMERSEYSIVLVRALERMTKESHGLSVTSWRRWWAATGRLR